MNTKQAVCAFVEHAALHHLYLSVTRPLDHTVRGMVGGRVEPGEGLVEAIKREMMEETGLTIIGIGLMPFFSGMVRDYNVTTFHAVVEGTIHTEETGIVDWVPREALLTGPFGEYNTAMFAEYDRVKFTDDFESWMRAKATPEVP